MKTNIIKRLSILTAVLLLVVLATSLVSCGGECTHRWNSGEFTVEPTCGTDIVGTRVLTCRLCGETKEETVQPSERHSIETVVIKEATCMEDGKKAMICKNCGQTKESTITALGSHSYDVAGATVQGGKKHISCKNCDDVQVKNLVVNYDDFGAKGDGVTDDSEAIRAAHTEANTYGLSVEATAGKTYYIGVLESTIEIQTNTDWKGAKIIFDDSGIRYDDNTHRGIWVFTVTSAQEKNGSKVDVPSGMTLTKGQTNIGMTFDEPCMLKIENSNDKIYKRYGMNANSGVNRMEMILVDENGNVDSSTPIQYDYTAVTAITMYTVDDEPISVGNALIETIAPNPKEQDPDYDNEYFYYARGINVMRSNTTLTDIQHEITNEDMTIRIDRNQDGRVDFWGKDKSYGVPYSGTFSISYAYNVAMTDCVVEGHQAYSFYETNGARNECGSYTINIGYSVKVIFDNVVQYENADTKETITNREMYHGIMGSNFSRDMHFTNCYLDRFDAHQGAHNVYLKDSTFGFGILIIGGGILEIENVERLSYGSSFITLRLDYNSIFDGDVVIKNCKAGSSIKYIFEGNWLKHDNGLPNQITTSLTIDGLIMESGSLSLYNISGASKSALTDTTNPLYIPSTITLSNIYKSDGTTKINPTISAPFSEAEIIRK